MGKTVHIYTSNDLTDEAFNQAQESALENLYGEDNVYLVLEDGSFIADEAGSSILIQENQ